MLADRAGGRAWLMSARPTSRGGRPDGLGPPDRRRRPRARGDLRAKSGGQRAFYSGKHKRHGLNVHTACSPDGSFSEAGRRRCRASPSMLTAAAEGRDRRDAAVRDRRAR